MTPLPQETLSARIADYIKGFSKDSLLLFEKDFRYSQLVAQIDTLDRSIRNNLTAVRLRKSFIPSIVSENNLTLKTNNNFYLPNDSYIGTLTSSMFSHRNDAGAEVANCTFEDVHFEGSLTGRLRIVQEDLTTNVKTIVQSNAGNIVYNEGKIEILGFNPLSYDNDKLDVFVRPAISDITPVRDQILAILDEDIKITMHAVYTKDGGDATRELQTVSSAQNTGGG